MSYPTILSNIPNEISEAIDAEVKKAETKFPGNFPTPHHAHSVILEELEEYWDCVKRNQAFLPTAKRELIQVAATAIRALKSFDFDRKLPSDGRGPLD